MQRGDRDRLLIIWGWITTAFLAPVGAIIGVVLITRNRLGHGIAQLVISVAWLWLMFVVLAPAGSEPSAAERRDANQQAVCDAYQYAKDVGDTAALVDMPPYCNLD